MVSRHSIQARARTVALRLAAEYPGTVDQLCALDHNGPFQLLVATILSAQCTDEQVNRVTPQLFAAYPRPEDLAAAPVEEVERIVRPTGFFRAKARSLINMSDALVDRFDGKVPQDMDDLTSLPGVGRKTANVVRSVAFGLPGLPVDTHVGRISRRLGLTSETDPDKVEANLNMLVRAEDRGAFSLRMILHGRAICKARKPLCQVCILADVCPSAGSF
ncbi:MAG: endonuclease III [Acidimicrobiales bacterium]